MKRFVVDASVAIKWFLPEVFSTEAQLLLKKNHLLLAPALIYPEVGNILWKRSQRKEITKEEALETFTLFGKIPLQIISPWPTSLLALEIAQYSKVTVYDSSYPAISIQEKAPLVTADQKFYNTLKISPLSKHILWIADL